MSDLDRYFEAYGRQLSGVQPRPQRRALALGGTGALAAAVVAFTLLLGGGRAPVDAVAAARAALIAQPGEIVHLKIRAGFDGQTGTFEQWVSTEPKRWRVAWGDTEAAYGDGRHASLLNGLLLVQTRLTDDHLFARFPMAFGFYAGAPENDIQRMLESGLLRDQGEVESGGRTVRRLTGEKHGARIRYDVDPKTFAPLAGRIGKGTFSVEVYEKLPLNAETEKLFEITPPPGTRKIVRAVKDRPRSAARRTDRGR